MIPRDQLPLGPIDPNLRLKMSPFSPPPFIYIPEEPRENNKLSFAPRSTLLHPLRDVWNGKIKDMVDFRP
jgi:hypothetical protein